ncbi:GNAT family N-acetyltransferase [Rhodococcus sp. 14-2483-1-1]|nr:GNAT family N-acetyltransferase [Rhodococcus sp. 14-2483-1-1]
MRLVPILVEPAIPQGSFVGSAQPVIEVSRSVSLRPWDGGDAAAVVDAFQDPLIQRWHVRRADSVEEAAEWIERWQSEWHKESGAHWAVVDSYSNLLLGRIGLKSIDLYDGTAELVYWMTASARGHGVCSNSVIAVARWAFSEMTFNRIELEHSVDNAVSCRVAGRAGFQLEGTRRRSARHADGWHDMHVHSLIRGDSNEG